jgi:hypothetical protein
MEIAEQQGKKKHKKAAHIIRTVYLYLVSMIGLLVFIFGCVSTIDNLLKNFVFQVNYNLTYEAPYPRGGTCSQPYADPTDTTGKTMIAPTTQEVADCKVQMDKQNEQNRKNQIGMDFSVAFAQLIVGLPVWLFHWGIIQKENRRKEEETNA